MKIDEKPEILAERRTRNLRTTLNQWLTSQGEAVPQRKSWPEALQRVHAYGLLIIFIGFIALACWSSFLASRFSLTLDYSFYGQAWFLIAHGHLNPYSSTFPPSYWHNALELMMWPLAALWYLWPHAVTLLWAQDAATGGCEAIVFVWMCEATARSVKERNLGPWSVLFPLGGLILLVANPWTVWINSFDFHPESISLFFALWSAHAFWRGRTRSGWISALLALVCGAIGATYVAGLGISLILVGKERRRIGAVLLGIGISWLLFISSIGGDSAAGVFTNLTRGSRLQSPGTLEIAKLIVEHPSRAISAVWSVRRDLFADISVGGVIGLISPWAFGISFLVLLEGSLTGNSSFIEPYVQNSLPLALLIPLGTILICITLAAARQQWKRIAAYVLAAISVLNVIGWSVTWFHRTESQWVSVPSTTAATLSRTLSLIHPNDEVIASQGIMGPFAFRQWIYPLLTGPVARFHIHSRTVWFVIAPKNGIQTESTTGAESQIGQIANLPNVRLVSDSDGVYAFEWRPGSGRKFVSFKNVISVPAWTLDTFPSQVVVSGPADLWHVENSGSLGYQVSGDNWRLHNGKYSASLRLSSYGIVDVRLLDASTGTVLASDTLPSTGGTVETRILTGHVINTFIPKAYSGFELFSVNPVEPVPEEILELQVFVPSTTRASVYSIGLANQNPTP
jgi:hypothetical protein